MVNLSEGLINQARQRIERAERVLVIAHVRPDGDAVGSLLGLGLALEGAGKQVQMVLADGVPSQFSHLASVERIQRRQKDAVDLVVAVDTADFERLGDVLLKGVTVDINIDHHPTNTSFGRINLVDSRSVAAAAILAECMPALGLTITPQVGEALLTGLITDSLGFRTVSTDAEALRIAADLVEGGADISRLYFLGLVRKSFEAVRYWAAGLSRLQREDGMLWTSLTVADRQAVGYPGDDDADLVNLLSAIEDATVAMIFIEQDPEHVKISWRAKEGVDVSQVATQFGGGGHVAAAGAMVAGSLEEVQQQVLQATRSLLQTTLPVK